MSVAVTASGSALLVLSDGKAMLVRPSSPSVALVDPAAPPYDAPRHILLHPSTGQAYTIAHSGRVWLWSSNGVLEHSTKVGFGTGDVVLDVVVGSTEQRAYVALREQVAALDWTATDQRFTEPAFRVAGYKVYAIHPSPDGSRVVVASQSESAGSVFELFRGGESRGRLLDLRDVSLYARAGFSPGGACFGIEDGPGVAFFDRDGQRLGHLMRHGRASAQGIVGSPVEDLMAVLFNDGFVRTWDPATARAVATIPVGPTSCVAFDLDGRSLLVGREGGDILRVPVSAADLRAAAVERVGRGLTPDECDRFDLSAPRTAGLGDLTPPP